jgi:hypothetical protein
MPHLMVALAVSFFTMLVIWIYLTPARIPLLTYFLAYTVTTVIGAAALLDEAGLREFKIHQPMFRSEDYPLIGLPIYWILLLAPFLLVPVGTALGLRAANIGLVDRSAAFAAKDEQSIVPIVYSIVGACALYCAWKLISTGTYFPELFFDRTLPCNVRLVRRTELFTELRYLYYAFAYAVIPIGAALALLSWMSTRRRFHAVIFLLLFAAVLYFNIVLYMKANLVVFVLTLLLGCIVAKAPWRLLIALGLATAVCLLLMQALLGCYSNPSTNASGSSILVVSTSAKTTAPQGNGSSSDDAHSQAFISIADSRAAGAQMTSVQVAVDAAAVLARSIVFRIAVSLPYYVQIFSNPDERCGIESNSLPFLPRETCYPPTKVGARVNPGGEIQPFQSAPAHITAYAELGLGYAFVVLLLGGAIMGLAWGAAMKSQSPLFWSTGAAVCVFAYYLTQAGLVGALTHSYGFVWYLFPLSVAVGIHALAQTIAPHLVTKSR